MSTFSPSVLWQGPVASGDLSTILVGVVFFRSVFKIHVPSLLDPDLSPVSLNLLASCSLKSAEKRGFQSNTC